MATRKVRYKKLSPKTILPILRADQADPSEYELLTNEGEIATGVEAGEQSVSFLLSPKPDISRDLPCDPPSRNTICRPPFKVPVLRRTMRSQSHRHRRAP